MFDAFVPPPPPPPPDPAKFYDHIVNDDDYDPCRV